MADPILVGACGWDRDDWVGSFYPDELPREWRFAYYSAVLSVVLVEARDWMSLSGAAVAALLDDCAPTFRFVLRWRLPPAAGDADAAIAAFGELWRTSAPLGERLAGVYLTADKTPLWLPALVAEIGGHAPVCPAAGTAGTRPIAGVPPARRLSVALADTEDPREQRRRLETLDRERAGEGPAALFFDGPRAAAAARQARTIAELLGV